MSKYIIVLPFLFLIGCSCFRSCPCMPEIKENEELIVPPDLKSASSELEEKDSQPDLKSASSELKE